MQGATRRFAAAAALAVALVVVIEALVYLREAYVEVRAPCCADHQYYLRMAGGLRGHPEADAVGPYAYRLLSPTIVRALPGSAQSGFHILSAAAVLGTLV